MNNAKLSQKLKSNFEALSLAEEQVIRSTKLASLGRLVAEVAHEVGNFLQPLLHPMHTLSSKDLSQSGREYLELVGEEVAHVKEILRELLSFSRTGDTEWHEQDVQKIVYSVLHLAKLHLNADKIEVVTTLDPDLPLIQAWEEQLRQVLYNVVDNAFDAMEEGGTLYVAARQSDGRVILRFTDTGPGIPEEVQQRVSEPFYTTKPPDCGTGLGLSISQSIVTRHGGSMRLESEEGQGTTVTIELPTVAEEGDLRGHDRKEASYSRG